MSSGDEAPWANWKSQIVEILTDVKDVEGTFAVGGQLALPYTAIDIEGAGKFSFPVYDDETAARIIKVCEQAPYGKKTETIVDTSVRNSWQLSPALFKVLNPNWEKYIADTLLPLVAKGLGIHTEIKSNLYKLLLYQTGSFFKPHRDSEKEDRMFATLVIQLPSHYEGGELVVKHGLDNEKFDFSSRDQGKEFCMFYSAFYCDCEHEVLPITSGYRVSLVYNLSSVGTESIPLAPALYYWRQKLVGLLKGWPGREPLKIACVLSHHYTQAGLSFQDLKGNDQTVVRLFSAAAQECPVILHLALLLKYENVGADCDEYTGRCCYIHDDTLESELSVFNWVTPDGSKKMFGEFSVDEEQELIPEDTFEKKKPDKQTITERTGNEGATVERWYHRAAVVVWPKGCWDLLNTSYVPQKIVFETFVDYIKEHFPESAERVDSDFVSCFEFALCKVNQSTNDYYHKSKDPISKEKGESVSLTPKNSDKALSIIVELNNLQVLQKFLELYYEVSSTVSLLLQQCEKYGWEIFYPQLKSVMKRGKEPMEILVQVMNCGVLADGEKKTVCEKLFNDLLAQKRSKLSWSPFWQRGCNEEDEVQERRFFKVAFDACCTGGFDLTEFLEAKHEKYKINIAAPVLAELVDKSAALRSDPLWTKLTTQCLVELEKITGSLAETPSSWRRSTNITCANGDCSCLKSFLLMDRETTTLNVAKTRRRHIEAHLRDLKGITFQTSENQKRYDIVVTKNNTEFEKQLKEYNHAKSLVSILKVESTDTSSEAPSAEKQPSKKKTKLDTKRRGTKKNKDTD